MPPKLQVDESFAFLFMCIDASNIRLDFKAIGDATELQPAAARMRYSRLRRAVEDGTFKGAVLIQPTKPNARFAAMANPDSRKLAAVADKVSSTAHVQNHNAPAEVFFLQDATAIDESTDFVGRTLQEAAVAAPDKLKRPVTADPGDDDSMFFEDTSRTSRATKRIKREEDQGDYDNDERPENDGVGTEAAADSPHTVMAQRFAELNKVRRQHTANAKNRSSFMLCENQSRSIDGVLDAGVETIREAVSLEAGRELESFNAPLDEHATRNRVPQDLSLTSSRNGLAPPMSSTTPSTTRDVMLAQGNPSAIGRNLPQPMHNPRGNTPRTLDLPHQVLGPHDRTLHTTRATNKPTFNSVYSVFDGFQPPQPNRFASPLPFPNYQNNAHNQLSQQQSQRAHSTSSAACPKFDTRIPTSASPVQTDPIMDVDGRSSLTQLHTTSTKATSIGKSGKGQVKHQPESVKNRQHKTVTESLKNQSALPKVRVSVSTSQEGATREESEEVIPITGGRDGCAEGTGPGERNS